MCCDICAFVVIIACVQVEYILMNDPEFPDEVSDMAADFVLNVSRAYA